MFIATVVVSVLLAAMLGFSAAAKITRREPVTTDLKNLGVPEERFILLATLLLAGAVGLLAGLFWAPLGIAAAACLVAYFLGAIGFHLRAKDTKGLPGPGIFLVLAIAALVLRIITL